MDHLYTFAIAGLGMATVTNDNGLHIPSLGGTGVVNAHGISIEDQTGATNNWAIKTGLGPNYFGDTTQSQGWLSADGTPGVTVSACTGFKNGLCISGT